MMVWMGMYSQSFLPAVRKTTARILEQTEVNVQIHVQAPASPGLRAATPDFPAATVRERSPEVAHAR
jgi:hypothetical protein